MALHLDGVTVEKAISTAVAAKKGVHVAHVTTANATDLATAEALANANKVAINALLVSLENAGILA